MRIRLNVIFNLFVFFLITDYVIMITWLSHEWKIIRYGVFCYCVLSILMMNHSVGHIYCRDALLGRPFIVPSIFPRIVPLICGRPKRASLPLPSSFQRQFIIGIFMLSDNLVTTNNIWTWFSITINSWILVVFLWYVRFMIYSWQYFPNLFNIIYGRPKRASPLTSQK